ncbi:MAG: hypothetical protein KDC44_07855, partial [Phaeodactylibacter sp.]|nr:hypothetical protein [Phaeodactylibacter sp.]
DHIESKVRQLESMLIQLKNDNLRLENENKQLKMELSNQQNLVGALKNKLSESQRKLEAEGIQDPERSAALKQQIDQYLLEIDKCIEWLQNA